jgi:hypothetical protein
LRKRATPAGSNKPALRMAMIVEKRGGKAKTGAPSKLI